MEWLTCVKEAIRYTEERLLAVMGPEEVADHVCISSMYLQKGFQVMTGYSIGEYIRNRRLYRAALELVNGDGKVIDIAFRYGYETPESFTKAFTRFHGAAPSEVRRDRSLMKAFLPLRINLVIQGGGSMNYVIEKNAGFKVIGFLREFSSDNAYQMIPAFWSEIYQKYQANLCAGSKPANAIEQAVTENRVGEYGICIDNIGRGGKFSYMIAGMYMGGPIPEGMALYELPEAEWAKFKCYGPLPEALQTVNTQIWNEWLPGNREYELAGKFNVEWYSASGSTKDADYQSAVWIPVARK